MDVLDHWTPEIEWKGFTRGAVSERAWAHFYQLVQLCHSHGHWEKATFDIRMKPPGRSPFGPESKYYRAKRRHEWQREIATAEGHMHRAAYLAASKICDMSFLLTKEDEGSPDWNLYWALHLAVRYQPDHTRGRYKVAALTSFDADTELRGDPVEIARRWLEHAGYREVFATA